YFGGSCNLWAGRSMLLSEMDMAPRAWVPHSGWPIVRAELAAHYPSAARILRLPPLELIRPESHQARMSTPEQALFGDGLVPAVSLWARSPMRFGNAYRRRLRRAPHVRVVLNANVTRIALDAEGNTVEALDVATLDGRKLAVHAKVFVLACGGLENARLRLVSRERQPEGIGNRFNQVGRYFMDHPRGVSGKVRLRPGRRLLPLLRGFPLPDGKVQLGIGMSEEIQRREGLLNHYATFEAAFSGYTEQKYTSFVQIMKVLLRRGHAGHRWQLSKAALGALPSTIYLLTPKEILPHPIYRWYWLAREALPRPEREETRVVVYFCEQPPDPESRVTLSRDTDRLGVNRLVLRWRIGAEVIESVRRLEDHLAARLEAKGIGRLERASEDPKFTDASHHMGTTRMSDDPRTGVVDRDCKVHGVSNLYIAGSSVFPSAGHANPTLTIVALALRLAATLQRRAG
ncbi:MAG: GMC oxidoreductase, partial [Geminicoccaceae bacterium]